MGLLPPKQPKRLIFLGVGLFVVALITLTFLGDTAFFHISHGGPKATVFSSKESSPEGHQFADTVSSPSVTPATVASAAPPSALGLGSSYKAYTTGKTLRPEPPDGWPDSPYATDQESFPGSRLVEELRRPVPDGGVISQRILQVPSFKYPYIRVESREDASGLEIEREEWVADHLMVALQPGVDLGSLRPWLASHGADVREPPLLGGPALLRTEEVSLEALPKLLEILQENPHLVMVAETDGIQHANKTPNDPRYTELYGMAKISAPAVWDTRTDASSVVVAVIDTGVRYTHEDLKDNMWKNTGETGTDSQGKNKETNRLDDDNNGIIDDVYGYDAANRDGDPMDDQGHGSHCAGTIAGRGNNAVGVAGVAWIGRIMAVKFLGASGSGTTSDAILGVNYARSKGAKVSSNSWGGGGYSALLEAAIREMNTAGCLFIASAGNNAADTDRLPQYPSCFNLPNVVSVAATDSNDALAVFSNTGLTTVDLGAPGVDVLSSVADSDSSYALGSGTSMACPHVSGAFALLAAHYPGKTITQLISSVLGSTDPLSALNGKCVTGGRLNVLKAMNSLASGGGGGGSGGSTLNNSYETAWSLNSAMISSTVDASRITQNGQSFWWTWTAPSTGRLRVNTSKSSAKADTLLTAFSGGSLATLKLIASNDNSTPSVRWSSLDLGVAKGSKITFRVDGIKAGQSLVLEGTQGSNPGPANDNFGAATVLSGTTWIQRGSNFNATSEEGEPGHGGYAANNSVWFVWTPTTSTRVTLSTLGSATDTLLAVYTGNTVSGLTLVDSNDNASRTVTHSQLSFTPRAGTTYRIALDSKYNLPGNYTLSIR